MAVEGRVKFKGLVESGALVLTDKKKPEPKAQQVKKPAQAPLFNDQVSVDDLRLSKKERPAPVTATTPLESKIDQVGEQINRRFNAMDKVLRMIIDPEQIAYTDVDNDNIVYYVKNGIVIIHNLQTNAFFVGDTEISGINTPDEAYEDAVNNPTTYSNNDGEINGFIKSYTAEVRSMVDDLAEVLEKYGVDGKDIFAEMSKYVSDISDTVFGYSEDNPKGGDDDDVFEPDEDRDDDTSVEEESTAEDEYDEDDGDEEEELTEDGELKPFQPEVDDRPPLDIDVDLDQLVDVDEVDPDSTPVDSSLKKYAEEIDRVVPDDEVERRLADARSRRRNRSIQSDYFSGNK